MEGRREGGRGGSWKRGSGWERENKGGRERMEEGMECEWDGWTEEEREMASEGAKEGVSGRGWVGGTEKGEGRRDGGTDEGRDGRRELQRDRGRDRGRKRWVEGGRH